MSGELGANFSVNISEATRQSIEKAGERIRQSLERVSGYGALKPTLVGKDEFSNKKEEFEMDYLEGSFRIEKADKGFIIEIATEETCKILVSESYHMYRAVEKIPEAMVMIIDDIQDEIKKQEKIKKAKEVLKGE